MPTVSLSAMASQSPLTTSCARTHVLRSLCCSFSHSSLEMRGFASDHGRADYSRSSRIVLKDFVKARFTPFHANSHLFCLEQQGKLLYCTPPPGLSQQQLQTFFRSFPF